MTDRPMRVSGGAAVTQAERPDYTGRVIGMGNDMVQVWITDRLGIVTRFVGHRDRAGGGYLLRSTGTEIPAHLQLPEIDDESAA